MRLDDDVRAAIRIYVNEIMDEITNRDFEPGIVSVTKDGKKFIYLKKSSNFKKGQPVKIVPIK